MEMDLSVRPTRESFVCTRHLWNRLPQTLVAVHTALPKLHAYALCYFIYDHVPQRIVFCSIGLIMTMMLLITAGQGERLRWNVDKVRLAHT